MKKFMYSAILLATFSTSAFATPEWDDIYTRSMIGCDESSANYNHSLILDTRKALQTTGSAIVCKDVFYCATVSFNKVLVLLADATAIQISDNCMLLKSNPKAKAP